jgi:hypothetical protein
VSPTDVNPLALPQLALPKAFNVERLPTDVGRN